MGRTGYFFDGYSPRIQSHQRELGKLLCSHNFQPAWSSWTNGTRYCSFNGILMHPPSVECMYVKFPTTTSRQCDHLSLVGFPGRKSGWNPGWIFRDDSHTRNIRRVWFASGFDSGSFSTIPNRFHSWRSSSGYSWPENEFREILTNPRSSSWREFIIALHSMDHSRWSSSVTVFTSSKYVCTGLPSWILGDSKLSFM